MVYYKLDVSKNYKNNLFSAYQRLWEAKNLSYTKPRSLAVKPLVIRVPTEQRINMIIAYFEWVYSVARAEFWLWLYRWSQ